jgi:hypothetical protein
MDEVFGEANFKNDLVWHYSGWNKKLKNGFEKRHDTILFTSIPQAHFSRAWRVVTPCNRGAGFAFEVDFRNVVCRIVSRE